MIVTVTAEGTEDTEPDQRGGTEITETHGEDTVWLVTGRTALRAVDGGSNQKTQATQEIHGCLCF